MKTLPGKLTISRIQNTFDPHDLMRIELHDETSGVLVTSVSISMSDFMLALTGLSHVPCEFDFHPEQVGKKLELKTETINFGNYSQTRYHTVKIRASEYEVDGWVCSLDENQRIEKTKIGNVYRVTVPFKRYVEESKKGAGE